MDKLRTRQFKECNYKAVYHDGYTFRSKFDESKPITELSYPEFYDIKLTSWCNGNCTYCYTDSTNSGYHFTDIVAKVDKFFGDMTVNERPLQVALGGGCPTFHPDFIPILKTLHNLGITPNYTTNGTNLNTDILDATVKYCGGVAVSAHPHLLDYWEHFLKACIELQIKTNIHFVVSDRESIDYTMSILDKYYSYIDYAVLLPYESIGRAVTKAIDYEYLKAALDCKDLSKVAFGANFYEFLLSSDKLAEEVSLYPPEIFSKFLDLSDMTLYPSSFKIDKPIRKVL